MITVRFSTRRSLQRGLTLIELIITIAIVGILASIATRSYEKNSNRAKQSEAKLSLTSYYVAQKTFYAEYSAYVPSLDAIGWHPDGEKRWYRVGNGGGGGGTLYNGVISGYVGPFTNARSSAANVPYLPFDCPLTSVPTIPNPDEAPFNVDNPQSFVAGASGRLKETPIGVEGCDQWKINELKRLENVRDGT